MVTIRGMVFGDRGEKVWNATVVFRPVRGGEGYPRFGLTDGEGAFEVRDIAPGDYTVVVTQRFYTVHTFPMHVTGGDYIEIFLVPDRANRRTY